jgi:VCBS repeat-containing protein
VSLTVNAVNDAPVVNDQSFSVSEDAGNGTLVGTVAAGDADAGQTLTFAITAGNEAGAFAIDAATGEITVADATQLDHATTPAYSLTLEVIDSGTPTLSDAATVTINVTEVNHAPVVNDQTFGVDESSASGTVVGAVAASDPDGEQSLTFAITAGNEAGAFAIDAATGEITVAGQLDHETAPSYVLTVEVTDSGTPALSDSAAITINVNDVNEAPFINDQSFTVAEGAASGTSVGTVSAGDPDAGQTLTYAITAGNQAGAFAIDAATGEITVAGQLDHETAPSYVLTVEVTDSGTPALSDAATITIGVSNVNEAPTAANDAYGVDEDGTLAVGAPSGVLANDSDPDGDVLSAVLVDAAAHGTLNLNADGSFTYAPNPDYHGSDAFTYRAGDGALDSNAATVDILIGSVNDAPVAADDAYEVDQDGSLSVDASGGVLANDSDVEGDPLSAVLVGDVSHGSLALNSDGSFSYTPDAGYSGADGFTYKAGDGAAESSAATVNITVHSLSSAFQQDAGPQGILSIEAESFDQNLSGANNHDWVPVSDGSASGGAAMESTPDSGTNQNTGYAANSPRMDYLVNFVHTGTHYVWVRGRAAGSSTGASDSVHVGLDGQEISTADRISSFGSSFGWSGDTMDGVVATIDVASAGEHTLNVWMREDGFIIDKVVLTVDSGYAPSGTGPAQSPRGGAVTAPAAPSDLSAGAASGSRIDLTWTDNATNEAGFRIERSADGTSFGHIGTVAGNVTGYSDTGLASGTTYHYRVVAYNSAGDSAYSNTASATTPVEPGLPAPWVGVDIGAVAAAGDAGYDDASGTYTVEGSGNDIWNQSDEFHYVYQALDGDGEIVARVTGMTNTNSWAKAGVMVRETLAADSTHAMMVLTAGNGAAFQYRSTTGGSSSHVSGGSASAPLWVKIVRSGGTLTGYRSDDGSNWTQVGSTGSSMAGGVYIGLAVTSHNDGAICTATMDNVSVTTASVEYLDFNDYTISSYSDQDQGGTCDILDGGSTLRLTGNTWKKIDLNYTVTANTVIEFDFSSTSQGEIHGLGMDEDDTHSSDRVFEVYGTQTWGIQDHHNYSGSDWVHYTINVGQSYTGVMSYLAFLCDHDVSSPTAESFFRNVRIYEAV